MIIVDNCVFCGNEYEVAVKSTEWFNYINGALVQDAFPDLSTEDREFLISSICPTCQSKIFG